MTDKSTSARKSASWVLIAYALICALALGFDLLTDRSFGASMLAVLPISLLALMCLVVGPWLEGKRKAAALRAWFVGAALILIVSTTFSLLGADQAKAGEIIFTYAVVVMALPSSLVLPFAETWLEPVMGGNVIARIIGAWIICIGAGWLQWKALGWLYASIQERTRKRPNVGS
jgi:uncharacterized membrane protein